MEALQLANILDRQYVREFEHGQVVSYDGLDGIGYLRQGIRLFRITELMYENKQEKLEELLNLYSSMTDQGVGLVFILHSDGVKLELAIGIKKYHPDANLMFSTKVLEASFRGQYPGSRVSTIRNADVEELQERMFHNVQGIASVTGIPSIKTNEGKNFIQGIDRFIDAMRGSAYTTLILADPVTQQELELTRQGYTHLSTHLSEMSEIQHQLTSTESESTSLALQNGVSEALSKAVGLTQTSTSTTTQGYSKKSTGGMITAAVGVVASVAAAGAVVATGGLAAPVVLGAAPVALGAIGGASTMASGMFKTNNRSTSSASSNATSNTETTSKTTSSSRTNTSSRSTGQSIGRTHTRKDRNIQYYLDRNERYLERIQQGQRYGFWNTGIYFLSQTGEVATTAATVFQGLFKGEDSDLEPSVVNRWSKSDSTKFAEFAGYLKRFQNPPLTASTILNSATSTSCGLEELLPTSMLSTRELTLVMGFPERSITGLPVRNMASFGRQVSYLSDRNVDATVCLGEIYHLGQKDSISLSLNLQSLTQHCLITGTTGAGKSNTSFVFLDQLRRNDIPFLVIEPSKGEYKVLETWNTSKYPVRTLSVGDPSERLLQVNPFEFPSSIHVLEHIDRLGQLFSASFPMYAAMPAIVDEALHLVYEQAGWDLSSSQYVQGGGYPTMRQFVDLLPKIIEASTYSEQMKSDYQGALVTRFKSLTRGVRGLSLCPPSGQSIPNEHLFDQSCIIDLRAVGSGETKAFFMGLLLLKLFEYRHHQGLHRTLKHVALVEEAHNLLRRTSIEQSQDGANPRGLAVEMFINAIAEMRAYGQGFTIVDQSPTSLDINVIKNTNTKITLRTPYFEDRELVGRSSNMRQEQMDELGKLETGVIAVYQNDWIEPVLCKVPYKEVMPIAQSDIEIVRGIDILSVLAIPLMHSMSSRRSIRQQLVGWEDNTMTRRLSHAFDEATTVLILRLYNEEDVLPIYKEICEHLPVKERPLSSLHTPWSIFGTVITMYGLSHRFAYQHIAKSTGLNESIVEERVQRFI